MSSSKKRTKQSEKLEIISLHQQGSTLQAIATRFGISRQAVWKIICNQDIYLSSPSPSSSMRLSTPYYPQIESSCLHYVQLCRDLGLPVAATGIKAYALKRAAELNITEFRASDGWFSGFKNRNSLVYRNLYGEAASVQINSGNWRFVPLWSDLQSCALS